MTLRELRQNNVNTNSTHYSVAVRDNAGIYVCVSTICKGVFIGDFYTAVQTLQSVIKSASETGC
jgi:hypothetical protein